MQPAPFTAMCSLSANQCDPNATNTSNPGASHCMLDDFQCWWHNPVTWIPNCATTCATSPYAVSGGSEPANPTQNPPTCSQDTSKVPSGSIVVDDEPNRLNLQGCGGANWSSNGTFAYTYGTNSAGDPIGAIDTHQLGTGLGGRVLFTHTENGSNPALINTGVWTPNLPSLQYYKVKLHLPGLGAEATNVVYNINPGGGVSPWKIRVNQAWNSEQWVTIGTFAMQNGGNVTLNNNGSSQDNGGFGYSDFDVAFDAVAFVPQGGTPGQPIGGPPGIQDAPRGSNPAFIACGCARRTAGDPVDTATGYFGDEFTDLSTPGRGMPLTFKRSYAESVADPNGPNKALSADGPFGWGWTDSYNLAAATDSATGNVTVHQEDGSSVTFLNSGGTYAPSAPRFDATLGKSGSNYVYTRRGNQIFTFDTATGRLTAESDLAGAKASPVYSTVLAYDGAGHLATITDPGNRTYTLTWTGNHITRLSDTAGRTVTYGYDAAGNLTDVYGVGTTRTPALKDDDHAKYTYDGNHLMTSMRTPANFAGPPTAVTSMVYDSAERVHTQTDANGHTTTFTYGPDGGLSAGQTVTTDPAGHEKLDTYQNGLLVSETAGYGTADAGTSSYTYDPVTLGVTTQTDPDGNLKTFTYDDHGNKTSESDGLGFTTDYTYDDAGNLVETVDPDGVATVNQYDQSGRLPAGATGERVLTSTTMTRANNVVESTTGNFGQAPIRTVNYFYDDPVHPGDRTRSVDPNGKTTTVTYDGFGDKTSVTDGAGDKIQSGYDTATGLLTSTVDGNGTAAGVGPGCAPPAKGCTTFGHDSRGNVTLTTDPLGHTTSAVFDADGNKTSSTNANHHTTISAYDPAGQLTKVTQPDTTTQITDYNPDGTVADTVDGGNAMTKFGYDGQGRKVSRTDPDNRTSTSHVDPAGRVLTTTDPAGRTVTLGSDAAGQPKTVSYSDGVTPAVAYTYDPAGHRLSMTDGTGTTTWTYNTFGEVTAQKQGSGATTGYGYDDNGNLASITYPGQGTPVARTYDDAERLKTVTDWNSNTTTFGYDGDGGVRTTAYPNGTTVTTGYDDAARATSTTAVTGTATVFAMTFGRDPAGQLSGQTISGTTQSFGYNAKEQLASDGATAYAMDAADNPVTVAGGSQAFDPAGQLCWASASAVATPTCGTVPSGAKTYTFDSLGQRKTAGTVSYGYNQAGRLTSYTGTTSATYTYDGIGRRTAKTANGTNTAFVWDTGTTPNLLADGTNSYLYGPDGLPIEQIGAGGSFWYVHDQVGSTCALLNGSGTVAGGYRYSPYGVASATGTARTPLQFTGQYTDTESGLVYLRARFYDPAAGLFLTVDPDVGTTGTPYAYTRGNPLNLTDLTGLCWSLVQWACDAGSWVANTAAPWVWQNRGYVELGLGVASLAIPFLGEAAWIGIAADSASLLGTGLTAADAYNACSTGDANGCVGGSLGAVSGGLGFGLGKLAASVGKDAKSIGGLVGWIGKGVSKLIGTGAWAHNLGSLGLSIASVCHGQFYDPNGGEQLGR